MKMMFRFDSYLQVMTVIGEGFLRFEESSPIV